jgi:hypothetical protein
MDKFHGVKKTDLIPSDVAKAGFQDCVDSTNWLDQIEYKSSWLFTDNGKELTNTASRLSNSPWVQLELNQGHSMSLKQTGWAG